MEPLNGTSGGDRLGRYISVDAQLRPGRPGPPRVLFVLMYFFFSFYKRILCTDLVYDSVFAVLFFAVLFVYEFC